MHTVSSRSSRQDPDKIEHLEPSRARGEGGPKSDTKDTTRGRSQTGPSSFCVDNFSRLKIFFRSCARSWKRPAAGPCVYTFSRAEI